MLSKSKKLFMALISAALSLQFLIFPCLSVFASNTETDVDNVLTSASNEDDLFSTISDQEIINGVLSLIDSTVDPKTTVKWATKKFIAYAFNISQESDSEKIMAKLDKLMEGQSKLQQSIDTLSKQVTCIQLNDILNNFETLASEQSPNNIYNALRNIDKKEETGEYSSEDAAAARTYALTYGLKISTESLGSASLDLDKHTDKLTHALLDTMRVTYEDGKTSKDSLFEINYQYLRRKYNWEHQSYDEWIAFQNYALGTYTITVTIDRLSLLARIEKIKEYNATQTDPKDKIYTDLIEDKLEKLDASVAEVKKLIESKVVIRDASERYYWKPGHEILFYSTPNTKGIPQENKNAGVGNNKALSNAKGLKVEHGFPTVKFNFWKPFIRYEGGNSLLANYDQLNMLLNDYDGKKSLYDIFFSETEGNFTLPSKVNQNCRFVIDEKKSEITGKSYPLTYEPYLFKADQAYCYGIENSKIKGNQLPSPSKIHLCYYHSGHADPKSDDNCVGIGIKSVGALPSNDYQTNKEKTHTNYNETLVWSDNTQNLELPIYNNIDNIVSVSLDDSIIDKDKYSFSDDKTRIILDKEFLRSIGNGTHMLIIEYDNEIDSCSFTIAYEENTSKPDNSTPDNSIQDNPTNSITSNVDIPQTGSSDVWKLFLYISMFSAVTIIISKKAKKQK